MKNNHYFPFVLFTTVVFEMLLTSVSLRAETYQLDSPGGRLSVRVDIGNDIRWSMLNGEDTLIEPSVIAMHLDTGEIMGYQPKSVSVKKMEVNRFFQAIHYTRDMVQDHYCELAIGFNDGDYQLTFRAYDDAVAYRFSSSRNGELVITDEDVHFSFGGDRDAFIPYMWDYRGGEIFNSSFEALYDETPISEFKEGSYAFLPLLADVGKGRKIVILEADLEDYPGLYLDLDLSKQGLHGVFARYPTAFRHGGYNEMNIIPTERAPHIAKVKGSRDFPWRVVAFSEHDAELLDNDIVQKLASPSRIEDTSWIQVGQVAWDWWNNWGLTHVDFEAGQNTQTYQYYIDFAAANGLEFIIIDEGWTSDLDLSDLNPNVDLKTIVNYGKERDVGVIVWASWRAVLDRMDEFFSYCESVGVKGLKIDFFDRDDQIAVASTYEIARKAAEHHLFVDYHGIFKPTGLQRTYPNVIGYEGVKGLENVKWADEDAPRYAVSIPFIRMMAGPMDYTPGAMRNVTQDKFFPNNGAPMSKGTRCHQIAMYVVYHAPLQMLSDSPSLYMQEQESTDFITQVPTVYDETVPLDGAVGEYLALARRSGEQWFVGAMANWDGASLALDFSFLPEGQEYRTVIFEDGANANRNASDYRRTERIIRSGEVLEITMAGGGGWAARLNPVSAQEQ